MRVEKKWIDINLGTKKLKKGATALYCFVVSGVSTFLS